MEWIDCKDRKPEERVEGCGTVSDRVRVLLTDGRIATDWLINGRWVIHCERESSIYPVKWKYID